MNKSLKDLPAVMTVPEFAGAMRIGRNRAYRLVRERKVPFFTSADLLEFHVMP